MLLLSENGRDQYSKPRNFRNTRSREDCVQEKTLLSELNHHIFVTKRIKSIWNRTQCISAQIVQSPQEKTTFE